jgi:hypothetical protein
MKTNGPEDPEIKPYSYSYLIFDKRVKSIHWRKTAGAGKLVIFL